MKLGNKIQDVLVWSYGSPDWLEYLDVRVNHHLKQKHLFLGLLSTKDGLQVWILFSFSSS